MSQLQSYIISAGVTDVFNFEVAAPDPDTALTFARSDWHGSGPANWTTCGPADKPCFQVEQVRNIPDRDVKTYLVSFTVTERLDTHIQATSADEAIRIGSALRDNQGTYDGAIDIAESERSDLEAEEVAS